MIVENNNVEGLYMAITCITFLVLVLNVVINLTPKTVNVSSDDNVMHLSYITIVSFHAYTFMFECLFESIKKKNLMFVD
jgi:Mg2+/Co2+ transporter CorB